MPVQHNYRTDIYCTKIDEEDEEKGSKNDEEDDNHTSSSHSEKYDEDRMPPQPHYHDDGPMQEGHVEEDRLSIADARITAKITGPSYDDKRYRCLCNTHVHKGTMIISIIEVIIAIFNIGLPLLNKESRDQFYIYIWPGVINIFIYALLLYGNRKKIKWMYFPFLIFHWVSLGLLFILSILFFILGGLFATKQAKEELGAEQAEYFEIILIASGIVFLIQVVLQCYFFYVVIRGYQYLKNVLLDPTSNFPRV